MIKTGLFIAGIFIILFSCHNKPEHYPEFVALNKINNYLSECNHYPRMVIISNDGKVSDLEITADG